MAEARRQRGADAVGGARNLSALFLPLYASLKA
ncbi:hypothetical protein METH_01055 [Leisingera methylohalidivorans DSM 14336]|uniref:Uncharacterized protein n=1 Tax=Leisingera methylohalidivorans DSM 14336 TaxID=999552 RepID=V9VYL7_9RHOB|nr:hypothetical protein METH_01055 [Leisingera methylohalidivorans DSM 14336]